MHCLCYYAVLKHYIVFFLCLIQQYCKAVRSCPRSGSLVFSAKSFCDFWTVPLNLCRKIHSSGCRITIYRTYSAVSPVDGTIILQSFTVTTCACSYSKTFGWGYKTMLAKFSLYIQPELSRANKAELCRVLNALYSETNSSVTFKKLFCSQCHSFWYALINVL